MRRSLFVFLLFGASLYGTSSCYPMPVDIPLYEGGFYGGFTWLYMQSFVSDADLQYCTALTLTGPPLELEDNQNLTAHTQELEPAYTSAYRFNLGYRFPCTNSSLDFSYFYFKSTDCDRVTSPVRNPQTYQFLQNFLGGGYASSEASSKQRVDKVDLTFSKQCTLGAFLNIRPYFGMSFAQIKRDLDVQFSDFVVPPLVNPVPASLAGTLKSDYWGIGPTLGTQFSFPIVFPCLRFSGQLEVSAFAGHRFSKTDSTSIRDQVLVQQFQSKDSSFHVVPAVASRIALSLSHHVINHTCLLDLTVGYETDYYFSAVSRINPADGYVNNPRTTPVNTNSHLALSGPYAQLTLSTPLSTCFTQSDAPLLAYDRRTDCGFYFGMQNNWLKPQPTNKDLKYAVLTTPSGSLDERIDPSHCWSGDYYLGYRFPCNMEMKATYRYFQNQGKDQVVAGEDEGIISVNSSGPADVLFSSAHSCVNYRLHQFDLSVGGSMQFCGPLSIYGFFGLRYADLKRVLHNGYFGGEPPEITQTKSPILRSRSRGAGPLFGIQPVYYICENFGLSGLIDCALLIGNTRSTLDQSNFGTVLETSSNDLSTGHRNRVIPVIDTQLGVFWTFRIARDVIIDLEVGYGFSEYFRAVNLVFPCFLTGLEQTNSNLLLSGPYLRLNISGF